MTNHPHKSTEVESVEKISISPLVDGRVRVIGDSRDNQTVYETHQDSVFVGGMSLDLIHDEFCLRPHSSDCLYIEKTETEVRITEQDPREQSPQTE